MNFKALLFMLSCSLMSTAFADANHHTYPQSTPTENTATDKQIQWPGYCEIEIINQSYDDVRVYGVFDDGTPLVPFNVYAYEAPHYISLYYYGYCHAAMELDIDSLSTGYHLFSGYTRRNSTIRIVPYMNQVKAEVHAK